MPFDTIQQISDALDQHHVRITTAQDTADFANTEVARAISTIYDVGLDATTYTNAEIQRLKDELRLEFQQADSSIEANLIASLNSEITTALPGLLNGHYGPYSDTQALYDLLITRFGQSDAAIDDLLNNVLPGLQTDVDTATQTATSVSQDFGALETALKSVLVVYAIDAAGNDQSLVAGSREYVRYVEYNGDPPTLPVSGTFTKFVGTAQSVWPIYASTSGGNDQSFEPGTRTYVTFYESPVAPDLPVSGQTFVQYVGSDGAEGDRGAGVWWVSVSSLPTTSSTAAQNAWVSAVAGGQDIPTRPKIKDQVYFYTGSAGNPTGQRVFICQWVTNDWNHGWDYQENVMRGDLLVPGTVTSLEIDTRGLSIEDESGNVILQATGGSKGIDWGNILGSGKPADNATVGATIGTNLNGQINSGNISTYIAAAAISSAYIGNLSAAKITSGELSAARIKLNGQYIVDVGGGALGLADNAANRDKIKDGDVTNIAFASGANCWISNWPGEPDIVFFNMKFRNISTESTARMEIKFRHSTSVSASTTVKTIYIDVPPDTDDLWFHYTLQENHHNHGSGSGIKQGNFFRVEASQVGGSGGTMTEYNITAFGSSGV